MMWNEIKKTKKAVKYKKLADEAKEKYLKEKESYTPSPGFEKKTNERKRATSAYQFWQKDARPSIVKKNPDCSNPES